MLRVGLTGGMGAGKSTVARALADLGAVIVDADLIAREVVAPGTPGLAALAAEFGADILQADGSLNRPALAAKAFADDAGRLALNRITHPLVGARTNELLAAASADAIVVQDVPLLVENHMSPMFHLVIAVTAPVDVRVRRLVGQRGVDEADARARIATQATDEQRAAAADVLLDNAGAPGAVEAAARALYERRLLPFEANIRARQHVPAQYRLVAADPRWPAQAARLIDRLRLVCGADALRIDHVGSTAVPGLDAKDVIDLQITVPDLTVVDRLADRVADAGYPRVGSIEHDDPHPTAADPAGADVESWGKRLHAAADPGRVVNVHLRADGAPGQRFALAFRDWLRADADARADYLSVKRAAAAKAEGLDPGQAGAAYLDVKEPWFREVYPRVTAWAATAS